MEAEVTEAEAREIVVTPEMVRAGWLACYELQEAYRDAYDEAEDGLKAAFPRMLRVWLEQGAPGWSASKRHLEAAR